MRRARLLRSTPFRLALSFGLFFIIAFLATGFVAYDLMQRELSRALDVSIRDTYSVVASTFSSNDLEDLIAAVDTYSALKRPEDQVFLLLNDKGGKLAGNVAAVPLIDGLSTVRAADLGLGDDDPIRIMAGKVGGNHLMIGQSYRETDTIERIAAASFAWATGIITIAVMLGGAVLASQAERRLEAIEKTLIEVSAGNLSHRIPTIGNGDDIDVVSTRMNDTLQRLSGLVDGMRQVSADIAHELKTPLNRLRMTVEQAASKQERNENVGELLLDAKDECDRINATFDALLRISQIEAGARKARFKSVDLSAVMSEVAEIYTDVVVDNNQTLQFLPGPARPCQVNGDRELLVQLFVNLVENAMTHCPPGTRIVMSLDALGRSYRALVCDDGPGVPERERQLVFRRLYRLDKSRTTPGSGLGLSLVKAIGELHSATISLDDGNPGLTVGLTFPAG